MVQEATQSPESEGAPSALVRIASPVGATLQTVWLLLSSLAHLTIRWLSRCPATAVLTVALTIGASYERQRAVAAAARPGQGLDAVVDLMRAEMSAGRPLALAEFATLNV